MLQRLIVDFRSYMSKYLFNSFCIEQYIYIYKLDILC